MPLDLLCVLISSYCQTTGSGSVPPLVFSLTLLLQVTPGRLFADKIIPHILLTSFGQGLRNPPFLCFFFFSSHFSKSQLLCQFPSGLLSPFSLPLHLSRHLCTRTQLCVSRWAIFTFFRFSSGISFAPSSLPGSERAGYVRRSLDQWLLTPERVIGIRPALFSAVTAHG